DPQYGARPIRRAVQTSIEDTVADRILRGEFKNGDHIICDVEKSQLQIMISPFIFL
ncbi:MAG: hypothetical protein RR276_02435, partial [Angelakisella sp.]